MPDPLQRPGTFFSFVGGLHDRPALVAHSGRGCGIGVDASPLAARQLFGVPAGSLSSRVVELDELFGVTMTAELHDRVHQATTWPDRFRVLDDVIGRVMSSRGSCSVPPEVVEAWRCIVLSKGDTSVEALAAHVGWSRRHLTSRFGSEIGLSPKVAMRVVRFEAACELLLSNRLPRLADVAVQAGFYDQSHLTREWCDLAGLLPNNMVVGRVP